MLGDDLLVMLTIRDEIDEDNAGALMFGMGVIGAVSGIAGALGWVGAAIATAGGIGFGVHHGIQVWRGKDEPLIGPR